MINLKKNLIALALAITFATTIADACSRFTYTGPENTVISGRSMDWLEDVHTDLWAFPAGVERVGSSQPNSVKWKAKYGSLIASGYDMATTDGINTEGLTANLLYLATTDYGNPITSRQTISISTWAQYMLDNYATVAEAVKDFSADKFNMYAPQLPSGMRPPVHLSLTDRSGDNAIFEYINGKLVIHHSKAYNVMTNEPTYEKQLALNDYWQNLQGKFLPGTGEPEDRFVRASYYLKTALQTADEQKAVATVFSIIRNVSVPYESGFATRPNVSATIWRSVADLKNNIYYFENTDRPNVFWVDIKKLNLQSGAPIKKLAMQHGEIYAGDVSEKFVESKPFVAP